MRGKSTELKAFFLSISLAGRKAFSVDPRRAASLIDSDVGVVDDECVVRVATSRRCFFSMLAGSGGSVPAFVAGQLGSESAGVPLSADGSDLPRDSRPAHEKRWMEIFPL